VRAGQHGRGEVHLLRQEWQRCVHQLRCGHLLHGAADLWRRRHGGRLRLHAEDLPDWRVWANLQWLWWDAELQLWHRSDLLQRAVRDHVYATWWAVQLVEPRGMLQSDVLCRWGE
jgi:hypothetical protein